MPVTGSALRGSAGRDATPGRGQCGGGYADRLGHGERHLGRFPCEAEAKAVLTADGKLRVSSATSDIGTGTYTIMTQIAAETLGLPIEDVTFRLGDSSRRNRPWRAGRGRHPQ